MDYLQLLRDLQKRGYTLREMEDAIGMSPNNLSGIISGKRRLPAKYQPVLDVLSDKDVSGVYFALKRRLNRQLSEMLFEMVSTEISRKEPENKPQQAPIAPKTEDFPQSDKQAEIDALNAELASLGKGALAVIRRKQILNKLKELQAQ